MKIRCYAPGGDLEELVRMGRVLDRQPPILQGRTGAIFLTEKLLKVRGRDGARIPLRASRTQREFEQRRGQRNIVLKARQMGVTTWVAGRFFLKTITNPGTLTVQVAHTQEAAESIFRCVHRFLNGLPPRLKNGALRTARANARQIVFPALDSEYRVETAGDNNAGRGMTIQNLHCSEVARWPGDAAEILAGLRAALPEMGELVLESTPNGADGCFYEEWQKADASGMVRHFFPWWWEEKYVATAVPYLQWTAAERLLAERYQLDETQIGFRRSIASSFKGLAKQEYAEDPEECFLSSGECVFDVKAVDDRLRELTEAPIVRDHGELMIWYPPVAGREYLVAVDPAGGGTEGDFSAAQVVEMQTALQCAELQGKMTALELAQRVAALAIEYNQALLIVERNNHGSGVLAYLRSVCGYPRIFEQGGQDGWLTSTLSRPEMIGLLGAALVEESKAFLSRRLLKECRSFVRHRNGKTGAMSGTHDDCVMAMAIALSARCKVMTDSGRGGSGR